MCSEKCGFNAWKRKVISGADALPSVRNPSCGNSLTNNATEIERKIGCDENIFE